jgi:serine/threonine-protein kinase 24/25/MST4
MAQEGGGVASDYSLLEELGSGSFGTVFKAIQRSNSEVVAIKMVCSPSSSSSTPAHTPQIDLESSEDDIQEIQQEISVLSTCASPFVTQYKASFLRGHKLWIVMEFLGGGSCLDLVRNLIHSISTQLTFASSNLALSMKHT